MLLRMLVPVEVVLLALGVSAIYDKTPPLKEEYDFVVVGCGTAGSVVVSRLSENKDWTVLGLEAGGDEGLILQAPVYIGVTIPVGRDWGYRAQPTPRACQGTSDRRCPWPRGKVMGGTSSTNYMMYTRGNRRDFDRWEAAGNPGWGYKDVLPYFLKSENQTNPDLIGSPYHSVGGPLTVTTPNYHTPLGSAFLESVQYLGYPIRDYNGEYQQGFQFAQVMTRDGRRLSANRAFLCPKTRKRPNLTLSMHSRVTRLFVDKDRVVGVEFLRNNKMYIVKARKEVILSAGTLNDPQILMLSGIGPAEHLKELDIPVALNLSVGYNLQDHIGMGGLQFIVTNDTTSLGEEEINDLEAVEKWLDGKGGPLSLPVSEALGYVSSPLNEDGEDWPDLEMPFFASYTHTAGAAGLWLALDNPPRQYSELGLPLTGDKMIAVAPYGTRPRSRGIVRLKSKNPFVSPVFISNYLSDPHDVQVVLAGAEIVFKIAGSPMFQKLGARFNRVPTPACDDLEFGSKLFWECWLRQHSAPFFHMCGTCKMGPSSDPNAVVDNRLRVYGMSNLRVVDLSIMPTLTSCHTAAVAIMIGEKGADMIKEDWSYVAEAEPESKKGIM